MQSCCNAILSYQFANSNIFTRRFQKLRTSRCDVMSNDLYSIERVAEFIQASLVPIKTLSTVKRLYNNKNRDNALLPPTRNKIK